MTKKITPELLILLRSIRSESDLLECLKALKNWFPENEQIGDALFDAILCIDAYVNIEPRGQW